MKEGRATMRLSARNQFKGTVKSVTLGTVMAEVIVDIGGGHDIVSAITRQSAEQLALREGEAVTVVIKATEVLIASE
jgi:molybdopterin-binding protein